jgi:hypothetical protein
MDEAEPRAKLEPFQALIGEWTIEMTHPMVEDTVLRGRAWSWWIPGPSPRASSTSPTGRLKTSKGAR